MLKIRVIPCLDVKEGRVVKGVNFVNLRDAGDPVEQARLYDQAGADELVFLDISATPEGRATVAPMVRRVADEVFLPEHIGSAQPARHHTADVPAGLQDDHRSPLPRGRDSGHCPRRSRPIDHDVPRRLGRTGRSKPRPAAGPTVSTFPCRGFCSGVCLLC